ncbi:hypothetical protein COU37_05085 [Candidatus Micrarchaeota archaeon CG10_big_fil_rev_8_21_14_0_10_45_29]|nr:MAG: hypothetical protein COU37_05085 [Candidatus Micrarchaeota archaeon CG10_big_fil_rev_8_21_14_0_10_45_29]
MEKNEKAPQSLMQKEEDVRPQYEMKDGIMHIIFRQPKAYVMLGKQKFALEEEPSVVIAGKKMPVGSIC